ncbi:LPXTG cell wall anchor domain-containing protein [Streptomyces californicus]|uniref:LPXTG cell wall anchor domain-containing protein n=1 Tax=Streptomyces californicus TaxID=67351 RepID=A0ABD7CQU5_9ACTN|nr:MULTISPECIES: LAETG motif-containing sortase-dependent surface protein [Streptomyces]QRV31694.1 LPXTG cell wall anchor domain-containing protein [Streptomyces californicus]QRV32696.1 LPXTG cell wall anchor domain-containing protein [Streptomyces californicus]QRV45110.1 LPXTG cell wall anchor domain-containing protein [Streptomyces californicus]QRV51800.1 LPXTG cell wall anchor domain-containing protein [Streptomyces californicus]
MTIPRRSWRGAGTFVAAAVVGLTGAAISAGPAAAHTPTWAVTCSEVTVDLTNYTAGVPNTVTVTVDGKDLLPTETFGREFHKKLTLPEHDEPVTVRLVVKDAEGDGKYSIDKTETAEVCEKPSPTPPTPTQPAPSETTATPEPSATPSEKPSESAPAVPAPSPSSPNLAETGSSSSTPVIGGAAVAVLLAGGGIMWSVRKRRTAQN